MAGEVVAQMEVRDDVFAVPFNEAVVHQAVVRHLANARIGTAAAKTRSQVAYTGRKMYRQKGTGRARHQDRGAPQFRGGGTAFGPHPRSYRQAMPKKMRRLAIRCLLSARASRGEMTVVDRLSLEAPRTKAAVAILEALGVRPPALVVADSPDPNMVLSMHNIQRVKTIPAMVLNAYDVYAHRHLVLTVDAVRQVESWLGTGNGED